MKKKNPQLIYFASTESQKTMNEWAGMPYEQHLFSIKIFKLRIAFWKVEEYDRPLFERMLRIFRIKSTKNRKE